MQENQDLIERNNFLIVRDKMLVDCKKKLIEKEQECERYKKEINLLNKFEYCYAYEKDCHKICKQQNCIIKNGYRYKQECEQKDKDIKYSMKCLDNSFKTQQDSELYWEREKKKLKAEKEKLKQTLIEIQQDLEFATYCESQECGCDDANECLECTKNHILQKISECEVENAR